MLSKVVGERVIPCLYDGAKGICDETSFVLETYDKVFFGMETCSALNLSSESVMFFRGDDTIRAWYLLVKIPLLVEPQPRSGH